MARSLEARLAKLERLAPTGRGYTGPQLIMLAQGLDPGPPCADGEPSFADLLKAARLAHLARREAARRSSAPEPHHD